MTLYITPFGRTIRRRAWNQGQHDEDLREVESDVLIPVNVRVEDESYVISALIPGVKADDLAIQVVNETVTIQGELKDEAQEKENYLLRERPAGRFYRTLRMPERLDSTKAEADLTDGVLTLRVPKAEEARPRVIKVSRSN